MEKNVLNLIAENIKRNKLVLYLSVIVFFVCHAYCFMNITYNHDSLMIYQYDAKWQIALGRFLQPLYCVFFRGCISVPLLIGTIEFIFLIISAFFIIEVIEIREVLHKVLAISILLTSTTVTLTNATYIFESDIYMLALLFAAAGAYVAIKFPRFSFFTIIFFIASLGLYQAFIQVGVVLLMFDVFKDILNNNNFKKLIKKSAIYIGLILLSLILYYIVYKLCLRITNIEAANTYNGLSNVGKFVNFKQYLDCFLGTYKYAILGFFRPVTILTYDKPLLSIHKWFSTASYIILFLISIFFIIFQTIKNKLSKENTIFLLLLLIVFPFGFNFVYFLSQGLISDLMTYSYCVVSLFVFFLHRYSSKNKKISILLYAAVSIISFNNIIFANQVYVKKNLERESTLSIVTRIIDRIEQTEGYIPQETPVFFIGRIENNNKIITNRRGFSYEGSGNTCISTVTYDMERYCNEYLAYPIKFADSKQDIPKEVLSAIHVFPARDCTMMYNGVLYIQLSEE